MAAGPAGLGAPWPGLPLSLSEVKGVKGVKGGKGVPAGRGGGQQHPRGEYFQTRLFLMRWVYFAKTLLVSRKGSSRLLGAAKTEAAAAAAGLVLGAAACYCLWRRAAGGGRRPGPPSVTDKSPPESPHTMDADALQKLIHLLQATDDPLIQEQALITLSNSAAFSVNQDIIRNLDGLSVIGGMLSDCVPKVTEKALNALNNLSMNIKNQEEIQVYIEQVCKNVESASLNSDLQLAGLRLLTNMSVTSDYHHKMINQIPCLLRVLSEGSEGTQIQVLKVLVNLSANPAMTRHFLRAQMPSLLLLFDNCMNKDILLRALVFAANLKKNANNEGGSMIQDQYSEDSVFSILCRDSTPFAQKLASLWHHPDPEVKEQVVRILTQ
ncbi:armadillo repeat-containing protein 10 [Aythya fuligula]|uniref:Armadillo repeat-containing protein 10 n=1 Tax=Aythya fuligula TaxID=219594 RepID=A0A6J3E270_AYTFU|nr:armadillo repeat-containing protein 10 [Aythya fuligula]